MQAQGHRFCIDRPGLACLSRTFDPQAPACHESMGAGLSGLLNAVLTLLYAVCGVPVAPPLPLSFWGVAAFCDDPCLNPWPAPAAPS